MLRVRKERWHINLNQRKTDTKMFPLILNGALCFPTFLYVFVGFFFSLLFEAEVKHESILKYHKHF